MYKYNRSPSKKYINEELVVSSLLDDGLITDIEYRIYASCEKFVDRRATILEIMLDKYKENPAYILEMCKRLTCARDNRAEDIHLQPGIKEIQSEVNPISGKEAGKNPFLNAAILQCMFDFSSIQDIKKFRLICRQWNLIAEPLLRKKSQIHFDPGSLLPTTFYNTFKRSFTDLPFTSIRFSSIGYKKKEFDFANLHWFFQTYGKNITQLHLDQIHIDYRTELDISRLFKNTINLTKLIINTQVFNRHNNLAYIDGTQLKFPLKMLAKIKSISLTKMTIILPSKENEKFDRIIPSEITLDGVHFMGKYSKILTDVRLHDFIDFSHATQIIVTNQSDVIFDMKAEVFNSPSIRLESIQASNLEHSRGKMHSFHTSEDYVKANQLEIKELRLTKCKVDLSVLPDTIEKLHLEECTEIICNSAIEFPELQFAYFQLNKDYFENVRRFAACQNLVDLEIAPDCPHYEDEKKYYDFDVKFIPKSVKRMKITRINLVGRKSKLNLDTLIVQIFREEDSSPFGFIRTAETISEINLKAKLLVISCIRSNFIVVCQSRRRSREMWRKTQSEDAARLIIKLNKKFKQFVLGIYLVSDERTWSYSEDTKDSDEESDDQEEVMNFSSLVDKEADYYIFQHQRGKAILQEEFEKLTKLNELEKY